jgi:hypothetical protein
VLAAKIFDFNQERNFFLLLKKETFEAKNDLWSWFKIKIILKKKLILDHFSDDDLDLILNHF